jgi:hypothetical protein
MGAKRVPTANGHGCTQIRVRGALPRFLRRPADPDYEGQVRGRLSRVAVTYL